MSDFSNQSVFSEEFPEGAVPQEGQGFTVPVHYPEDSLSRGEKPVKPPVRRIGTFTVGVSLLAAGCLLLAHLFYQDFDLLAALRFSPIVLILLGAEILISSLFFRGYRLKYDFFSCFVSLILIVGSLGAAAAVPLVEKWGPERHRMEENLADQIEDIYYKELKGSPILGMAVYVDLLSSSWDAGVSPETLEGQGEFRLLFRLPAVQKKESKEEQTAAFAESCQQILQRMEKVNLTPSSIILESEGISSVQCTLSIYSRFQYDLSREELAQMVRVTETREEMEELEQRDDGREYLENGNSGFYTLSSHLEEDQAEVYMEAYLAQGTPAILFFECEEEVVATLLPELQTEDGKPLVIAYLDPDGVRRTFTELEGHSEALELNLKPGENQIQLLGEDIAVSGTLRLEGVSLDRLNIYIPKEEVMD